MTTTTATQENKAVIKKLYEQALNQRNMGLLSDLIADDFVGLNGKKGVQGFEEPVGAIIKAVPDVQWKIQELVAEDNNVAIRWQIQGTHRETFNGIAATGQKVSNEGMAIFELEHGKVKSYKILTDRLGFLQQLGVLPADVNSLGGKKEHPGQIIFIDKFFVPKNSIEEFTQRMNYNRSYIKNLPGFVEDTAYQLQDADGNYSIVTTAIWESQDHLTNAKNAVQAEYKRVGFNPVEFYERLGIKMERGIYNKLKN
ncbi:MAG: ester cyclase [Bacteroidota bacterium]